jgi:hypothetical protein
LDSELTSDIQLSTELQRIGINPKEMPPVDLLANLLFNPTYSKRKFTAICRAGEERSALVNNHPVTRPLIAALPQNYKAPTVKGGHLVSSDSGMDILTFSERLETGEILDDQAGNHLLKPADYRGAFNSMLFLLNPASGNYLVELNTIRIVTAQLGTLMARQGLTMLKGVELVVTRVSTNTLHRMLDAVAETADPHTGIYNGDVAYNRLFDIQSQAIASGEYL